MTGGFLDIGNTTGLWVNSSSYVMPALTPGATYYWEVRSRPAGNTDTTTWSAWSSVSYFTVSPGASAVVPLIGSPNYGQPINTSTAILSWIIPAKSSSALKYDIQYADNPEMKNSTTIHDVNQNYVKVDNLKKGTYYWRAMSKTGTGSSSNYSAVGTFKTGTVTDVQAPDAVPTSFELSQNYPNPFNPSTIINYALPKNSFVTLKIYNVLGEEVKTLVSQEMNAGNYAIEWDGANNNGSKVASGVYIYRITAGNFVSVKKMLLMK